MEIDENAPQYTAGWWEKRMMNAPTEATGMEEFPTHVLQSIVQALRGMRFGQVTVIVQDGRVIQIDRTERHRFSERDQTRFVAQKDDVVDV